MTMTLRQLRDRLSLAQAAVASIAVLLGSGMRWSSFALAAALIGWAFYRPLPLELSARTQRLWTAGIFVALVATLARAILLAEFLDAGVDFLLLLMVQRLFNRQRAREHLQLLMLGTLMMVVAAVVNTGLDFPLLFGLYLVVAVMTLIVNHLLAEGERLGARVEAEVARAGLRSRASLWRAALGVASLAAVGALAVFLLFPRWGVGVFLRGTMARDSQSGFSGEVSLGQFGRIKSDASVAARIKLLSPAPPSPRLTWHLRGSSFDKYDNGRWSHGTAVERTPVRSIAGVSALAPAGVPVLALTAGIGRANRSVRPVPIPGFAASTQAVRAQVTLEDLGVDALFAASTPLGIRIRPRGGLERERVSVRGGFSDEFKATKPPGPLQYEFVSRLGEPTARELRAVGDPRVGVDIEPYLQLSEGLSDEFRALARRVAGTQPTRFDKVDAVLAYLGDFGYTTDLEPSQRVIDGADPVEGFLFEIKEGHCEYFATAMATMLREVGVPTRIVNGFYGAHYNDLGDFYAVRQADAHSWVEVHFDGLGWITFDPTPPAGRTAGDDAQFWPAFSQAADALRNSYLEYVIDYNLTKQLALLEDIGVRQRGGGGHFRVRWSGVALYIAAGGMLIAVVFWWRRRRRGQQPSYVRLHGKLLALLSSRGYERDPYESPTRFADRLAQQDFPGAGHLQQFAIEYERQRFGSAVSSDALAELDRVAAQARRAIQKSPRVSRRRRKRPNSD